MTASEVIALYLRHSQATNLHGQAARAEREYTLGLFSVRFGGIDVSELKPYHLSDWIEGNDRWKSVSTRRAKANCVRAAFEWAAKGERIDRNPFKSVRYAEAERRPDMPEEVIEQIAKAGSKPFERAIRFLRLTGCRLGELCAAKREDFDLGAGLWIIHRHKSRRFTCRPKVVALLPEAVAIIRTSPEGGYAFVNLRGKPWTRVTLGQTWRRLKKRLGIETAASLHGIRHRFATSAIGNGAPIKLVAEQLGHASAAVTERFYWHRNAGHLEAIREAAALSIRR